MKNLTLINVYSTLQGNFMSMANLNATVENIFVTQDVLNLFNHDQLQSLFGA